MPFSEFARVSREPEPFWRKRELDGPGRQESVSKRPRSEDLVETMIEIQSGEEDEIPSLHSQSDRDRGGSVKKGTLGEELSEVPMHGELKVADFEELVHKVSGNEERRMYS